ncbi:hypothetical protein MMC30_004580 [Trapelia coarctata]|nr:hypothetical protein [Trapelia coarctata]
MSSRAGYEPIQAFHTTRYVDDTTSASTTIAYGVLLLLAIYYVLHHLEYYPLLSIPELAWNCLVYIAPESLVLALDKRPITAETKKGGNAGEYSESRTFAAKSEAMRHVLGLDGTGIFTRVQRARTFSGISTVFKTPASGSLPGLGNWDNSCYQNSVIQGLASLPSLSAFLDQMTPSSIPVDTRSTSLALRNVIRKLNDPANAGQKLWTPAELKSMSSWQQQDAQEYYSKVLGELEKETSRFVKQKPTSRGLSGLKVESTNEAKSSHDVPSTPVNFQDLPDELASILLRNPLEGLLAQRVGCLRCGFVEGLSLIPFNCLTVPLGKKWEYDIRACLDDYTSLESISGVECAKCTLLRQKQQLERLLRQSQDQITNGEGSKGPRISAALYQTANVRLKAVLDALETEDFSENTLLKKCHIATKSRVSTTKSKQAAIARLPQSLVIHVNRSIFNEMNGVQSKNHANVRFPSLLDLTPWCLGESQSSDAEGSGVEIWNTDPSSSMLTDIIPEKLRCNRNDTFSLQAVITHYGRHENGHYICYRRDPHTSSIDNDGRRSDDWWRLSDDDVCRVDEEDVLDQGGVFMLFYERVSEMETKESQPVSEAIASKSPEPTTSTEVVENDKLVQDLNKLVLQSDSTPTEANLDEHELSAPTGVLKELSQSTDPENSSSGLPDSTVDHPPHHTPLSATTNQANPTVHMINDPNNDETLEAETLLPTNGATMKENQPLPPPMRTAGAKRRKGGRNRAGKAMSSVSSMVTAN